MEAQLTIIYMVGMVILIVTTLRIFFSCKHAWELVDKTQLPSKLEEIRKFWPPDKMQADVMERAAKVCATLVVRCPRCGRCKVIRMTNEG
jgi:hypothetical protein